MAIEVIKDVKLTVDGDPILEDVLTSFTPNMSYEDKDRTTLNVTKRQHGAGLGDDSADIGFFVDAAVAKFIQDRLGQTVTVAYRANKTAPVSATNPEYTAQCTLLEFNGISASVGDDPTWSGTWPANGWTVSYA